MVQPENNCKLLGTDYLIGEAMVRSSLLRSSCCLILNSYQQNLTPLARLIIAHIVHTFPKSICEIIYPGKLQLRPRNMPSRQSPSTSKRATREVIAA